MWELIRANKRKSFFLFFCMGISLLILGYVIAAAYNPKAGTYGLVIALGIWIILSLISYFSGDSIILATSKAKEISHDIHPRLFNIVEEMKIAANLPNLPKVYIIEDPTPNAFAVGRNPQKSAIAVTSGLLEKLNRDELQGVIAHETSHIMNRDVLFCTFAGIMLGSIVLLSQVFLRGLFFSGGRSRSRSSSSGGGQAQIVIMVIAIVFAILAPIMARLLYLAISRKREYLADASGARLTRYPEGLASALEKISTPRFAPVKAKTSSINKVTAPMYIVNPFEITKMKLSSWSSTHPPTSERVKILRSMHGANFLDYEKALANVHGTAAGIMPASALQDKETINITKPKEDKEQRNKEKVRQVGDILRAVNGYAFLACVCGLKIKLPANYKKPEVTCPRCHRHLKVPVSELAAATIAASEVLRQQGKAKGKEKEIRPTDKNLSYTKKGSGWETFTCPCGKLLNLSPAFKGSSVNCHGCGNNIAIKS